MVDKAKISNGRAAVDSYRAAHAQLYTGKWHKGIPEEHTPLLEKLVDALEKGGFVSAETDFKGKTPEILAKFWSDSDLLNIQEIGFASREDFDKEIDRLEKIPGHARANELREALMEKWK